MIKKNKLFEILVSSNIDFKEHKHQPFFTVEDSTTLRTLTEGTHSKNFFLKNKKNRFVLFSCEENSIVNLKEFSKNIKMKNLSFAKPEYLNKYLRIKPGSVSPFALLNDVNNIVEFYLEELLYKSGKINFHPMINTSTIALKTSDFIKFMINNKKKINIFSISDNKLIKTYE